MPWRAGRIGAVLLGWALLASPGVGAPQHVVDAQEVLFADGGTQVERARTATWQLAEERRLAAELDGLKPQRRGVIDAFVVVAALDGDAVFGREAREAARVLSRRYGAAGHVILLAGPVPNVADAHPIGSPAALATALARVRELMDPVEDVLILYTTSHGSPAGIAYRDGENGWGAISPFRLYQLLDELGIKRRMLLISACYSGVFVPVLRSEETIIATAASDDRSSFGCLSENDWTFFGDALINHALRKPQPFAAAFADADGMIGGWEKQYKLKPSQPQLSIGGATGKWLAALERSIPSATLPVGRPSIVSLEATPAK